MINETKKYNVLLTVAPVGQYAPNMASALPSMEITDITLGETGANFKLTHGGSVAFKYVDLVEGLHNTIMGNNIVLFYHPMTTLSMYGANVGMNPNQNPPQMDLKAMVERQVPGLAFSPMTLQLVEPLRGAAIDRNYKYGQPSATKEETTPDVDDGWIRFTKPFAVRRRGDSGTVNNVAEKINAYRVDEHGRLLVRGINGEQHAEWQVLKDAVMKYAQPNDYCEEHRVFLTTILDTNQPDHLATPVRFTEPLVFSEGASEARVVAYSALGGEVVLESLFNHYGLPDVAMRHRMSAENFRNMMVFTPFKATTEHDHFVYMVIGYEPPIATKALETPFIFKRAGKINPDTVVGFKVTADGIYLDTKEPHLQKTVQTFVHTGPMDATPEIARPYLQYMDDSEDHLQIYRAVFNREPTPLARQFTPPESDTFPTSLTVDIAGVHHKLRGYCIYREGVMLVLQNGAETFAIIDGMNRVTYHSATATLLKQHPEKVERFKAILDHLYN